jgi:hypothetical protein
MIQQYQTRADNRDDNNNHQPRQTQDEKPGGFQTQLHPPQVVDDPLKKIHYAYRLFSIDCINLILPLLSAFEEFNMKKMNPARSKLILHSHNPSLKKSFTSPQGSWNPNIN